MGAGLRTLGLQGLISGTTRWLWTFHSGLGLEFLRLLAVWKKGGQPLGIGTYLPTYLRYPCRVVSFLIIGFQKAWTGVSCI